MEQLEEKLGESEHDGGKESRQTVLICDSVSFFFFFFLICVLTAARLSLTINEDHFTDSYSCRVKK